MSVIVDIVVVALLVVGGLFCLVATAGILLMPDFYTRMQAASKAVTLGATSILLAAAVHAQEVGIAARCLLACVFLFVTIPAASHLIARAAYRSREPFAPETAFDESGEQPAR